MRYFQSWKQIVASLVMVAGISAAAQAFALTLDEARASGTVGERRDGYVAAVSASAPADVVAFVKDINAKRREKYMEISKGNGQPLNVVESIAFENIFERLDAGSYYMDASGNWVKK